MNRGLVFKAAIATVASVGALVIAWALWPSPAVATRARQYLDVSACLLTGPSGIAPGTPGAQAWHAMRSASLASHVMVSYLPATGPTDVPVLLNTLVERRCGVIVVTGATRIQVAGAAKANPSRRFVFVTTGTAAGPAAVPPNTVVVPAAGASGRIDQEVSSLAGTA
jgi:hypothetical protein